MKKTFDSIFGRVILTTLFFTLAFVGVSNAQTYSTSAEAANSTSNVDVSEIVDDYTFAASDDSAGTIVKQQLEILKLQESTVQSSTVAEADHSAKAYFLNRLSENIASSKHGFTHAFTSSAQDLVLYSGKFSVAVNAEGIVRSYASLFE